MRIVFLGTGTSQGVPVIACGCQVCQSTDPRDKRLRTSAMVEVDGKNLVIDSGPDFRQQMLRENVDHLDALIFTHEHKDHLAGMDDIRAFNFYQRQPVDIYATGRVQEALRREFHYVFAKDKYPGVPEVRLHTIDGSPFIADGIKVNPIEVTHYKMPVLGFRIRNFTYITDAKTISEDQKKIAHDSDVLVLNALRKKEHISHFNLEQAIELANELNAKRAYFTHMSHFMGKHADVEAELPENMHLAYDGLTVEL